MVNFCYSIAVSRFSRTHKQKYLLTPKNPQYRKAIHRFTTSAFLEDLGKGDATTAILFPKKKMVHAQIIVNEPGIFAGQQEIEFFLTAFSGFSVKFLKKDGERIKKGECMCEIKGDIRDILKVERTVLNLFGRMCGIATFTNRMVKMVRTVNRSVLLCPTRKTLWGLLDKRAVALGGGGTHRLGLNDAILIKDNHLDALHNDISTALEKCSSAKKTRFIEIEVGNAASARKAAETFRKLKKKNTCFIMLDNFSVAEVKATIRLLKKRGLRSVAGIEVSGGVTGKNIVSYAKTGVNIISMGRITHSVPMLDMSLELFPNQM